MSRNYGLMRVVAVTPEVKVADPAWNAAEIIRSAMEAEQHKPSVIVFPELSVSAYTCGDLFGQEVLIQGCEKAVEFIANQTATLGAMLVVGAPVRYAGRLYNCAIAMRGGKILGMVPKIYLPGNGEFYEPRWFASGSVLGTNCLQLDYAGQTAPMGVLQLFRVGAATIGIEVCQDLWVPVPPCSYAALAGAQVILNLSASNETLCKQDYRKLLLASTSARLCCAYVYCSCGIGESTQDLVWSGASMIYENGSLMAENERFQLGTSMILADLDVEKLEGVRASNYTFSRDGIAWRDAWPYDGEPCCYAVVDAGREADTDFEARLFREVDAHPFVPSGIETLDARCREIISIQVLGLVSRLRHINCRTAVIGISGGLDSTLALLVTVLAFDRIGWERSRIVAVTMPGFGTTDRTHDNATVLMQKLGVTIREISIVPAAVQHLKDLGHDLDNHDVTYENAQARERTQILMDISNQTGGIVVGTGDLSELALGWCTYNGDHMSMYAVNSGVPKTLVKTLVKWAAERHFKDLHETLMDIIDTPVSPELTPAGADGKIQQITEDLVGPYELHDFFLYNFFRWGYAPSKLYFLAKKAFAGVYDDLTIEKWLRTFVRRFFNQQFKRSCLPDGPKVGTVTLSPRGDWRMPSDASSSLWISDLNLEN